MPKAILRRIAIDKILAKQGLRRQGSGRRELADHGDVYWEAKERERRTGKEPLTSESSDTRPYGDLRPNAPIRAREESKSKWEVLVMEES